jgi:peptidoglycan/xylan/chitin deacetylase (PgdA/CDA1 family)
MSANLGVRVTRRARLAGRRVRADLRGFGTILMYHRVADEPHDPWQLCVTPPTFADQMQALVESGRPVVPLRAIAEHTAPPRAVAITFDDGYVDNLRVAAPVLARLGLPATVFVTSGTLDSGKPMWWDTLVDLVLRPAVLPPALRVEVAGRSFEIGTADRTRALDDLWAVLLAATEDDRRAALAALTDQVGPPPVHDGRRMLTTAELVELAAIDGVEIGCHTTWHTSLVRVSPRERDRELRESKAALEDIVARPVDLLAYPNGHTDADVAAAARRAGFRAAVTTVGGHVGAGADPLLLPRVAVPELGGRVWRTLIATWG